MAEIPPNGVRIKVLCAGVCYTSSRSVSTKSTSSGVSITSNKGIRDTSLFPGFEVAGRIEKFGDSVDPAQCGLNIGDDVIVYPYVGCPDGYAEDVTIDDVANLVKVPESVPMPVAVMLPSGGLWAMNTVFTAREHVRKILRDRGNSGKVNVLVVGTGSLAHWGIRIARHYFPEWNRENGSVQLTVAVLRDEGLQQLIEQGEHKLNIVQWSEDCYEDQLVERTINACDGRVDVVIDFAANPRSLNRSLKCLSKGGVIVIGAETAQRYTSRFESVARENDQTIVPVDMGSLEQLKTLLKLVADKEIEPPPYNIFPSDQAEEVLMRLGRAKIHGRAILQFQTIDEVPS